MLMGTPVASSAMSTVATALPLWLTATVALRQFAAVIAISLSLSFVYALLMLVPLLGMFGPNRPDKSPSETPGLYGIGRQLLAKVSVRAGIACTITLAIMVRLATLLRTRVFHHLMHVSFPALPTEERPTCMLTHCGLLRSSATGSDEACVRAVLHPCESTHAARAARRHVATGGCDSRCRHACSIRHV